MRRSVWNVWTLLTSCFVCEAFGLGMNCSDYKGNLILDGKTYQPNKDMCQTCQCDNGFPIMCRSVKCAPPSTCIKWKPLSSQCCKFECLETDSMAGGDNLANSTRPLDNGVDQASSDNITTLGLRLVASTVTSFLVLALLLFMVHRLRQRRLMMAMRRYQDNRRDQMDEYEETVIPDYWIQCPPYEDPPPPYTPPKPDPRLPPREAPPPYEEVPKNNNINMTAMTQDMPQQNGTAQQDTPTNSSSHGRQTSDRIQQALNTELLQSLRFRQQLLSRSSSEESVDMSLSNHRVHYIRKSNSTATTGGLCNNSRNSESNRTSDRGACPSGGKGGTCTVGHRNSFAMPPSTTCGDNVPWHRTGYSLPKSRSNVTVGRSRNDGHDRPIRRSSSGSSNVHQCSHRGVLPLEQGTQESQDLCRLDEMCESYNNNNITATNVNNAASSDSLTLSQLSDRRIVSEITDTLEGYVPPFFHDQSPASSIAHHQRYGSLPSNLRSDAHMSASAGHVRSSSHNSAGNTVSYVDPCPLLPSECGHDSSAVTVECHSQNSCDHSDQDTANQLVSFRSPRRPQSLEHLRPTGHAFNIPDISTISESGLSTCDSNCLQQSQLQQQQNLQDLQVLRELRLSNLLQSPESGPSNIANSPPSPVQSLAIQGAAMPRSSSIVSDVSMFSVCSETGEKKLSQITGQALRSDAQYPENAFVSRPMLSVFSGADNSVSANSLQSAGSNTASGNVIGPNCVVGVDYTDDQNGNVALNNFASNCNTNACGGREIQCDKGERDFNLTSINEKDEKQKSCRENRLPHVKLRQKNKHKSHRSSSGSLSSSSKKRQSGTSDLQSESAVNVRSLPRSRSEVKHPEQLLALRKQYRMRKGDPQFVRSDTAPSGGHSHHSFYGDPDYVTQSPSANNWGEVPALYAVASIMGDARHSKSKSKSGAAHKTGSGNNKLPKSPPEGTSSLFCPTNVAFVKKKTKSNKRGRQGVMCPVDPQGPDIKISGYTQSGSKVASNHRDIIELSPMHELPNSSLKFKDMLRVDNPDGVMVGVGSHVDNNNYNSH